MPTHRLAVIVLIAGLVLGGVLAPAPDAASAAQGEACFAETGQCLRGRFLDYWRANGGLARNGFPLSGERRELLEDGNEYTVQYFERVRLELHPENPPPYDVLLGQFGRRVLNEQPFGTGLNADPLPGETVLFPETSRSLSGRFLDYWRRNGGLAQFGYPISEPFRQTLEDGNAYVVQYLERARFELHPENAPPYDVLLGQFGRRILADNDLLADAFRHLYLTDLGRSPDFVGRPASPAATAQGSYQTFERGQMLYRGDTRRIYVLCGTERSGRQLGEATDPDSLARSFPDTFGPGQDAGGGPGPRPGLYEPRLGFGKLWRENREVRDCIGYATTPDEATYTVTAQVFERGSVLVTRPDGRTAYLLAVATGGPFYQVFDLAPR